MCLSTVRKYFRTNSCFFLTNGDTEISTNTFFDENGPFYESSYKRAPHKMDETGKEMDIETESKYSSDGEVEEKFQNNPYNETQYF